MKFQTFLCIGLITELCLVPMLDAKRSFGITRSRSKSKGPSVRRTQHGPDVDDPPIPAVHPKPSAPDMRKSSSHGAPAGPPPAYPGLGHNPVPAHGAPPGYSPSYGSPPGYSSNYGSPPGYSSGFNQPRYNQMPSSYSQPSGYSNQFGSYGGGMPMGGMPMGGMPMGGGVMPMGSPYMGSPYGGGYRSSGMGSGIMTNLFAGLAGYQLAKAFGGGYGHRDREIIIVNNTPQEPSLNTNPGQAPLPNQQSETQSNPNLTATENTQTQQVTQIGPAANEYNYWGIPQYGIPLYGYSLPSQITDYHSSAIVKLPLEQTHQTPSEK